jgi:excisionase family DNA binding protein
MNESVVPELPELITIAQAAKRLTVCRRTIEREIARGRFPRPVRIGRALRVPVTELQAYVARLQAEPFNS